jgi:cysteine desulfurase/selenocysteine lyase
MNLTKLLALRAELPVTERYAYLNHASIGPLPQRAVERISSLATTVATSGDRFWLERNDRAEEVRRQAARLIGAQDPREVAFVENTSSGISLIAEALDWQPGEFPSNAYPWMNLASRGVVYRAVPERDGRIDTDELLDLIDEHTRVLAISWVEYSNGFRFDLARVGAFCRACGVLFVVDVIQGLGALKLDVESQNIDVACASAHKWLLGPEGIGLLYVSNRVVERLRPQRAGWRSMRDQVNWTELDIEWGPGAQRYESGTLNFLGIHALGAALEIFLDLGPADVESRVLALADLAARGLAERGFTLISSRRTGETSGIICAVHPKIPAEKLVERLLARDIVVSARSGRLRLSPHVYNTAEEIQRLLDEVSRLT